MRLLWGCSQTATGGQRPGGWLELTASRQLGHEQEGKRAGTEPGHIQVLEAAGFCGRGREGLEEAESMFWEMFGVLNVPSFSDEV